MLNQTSNRSNEELLGCNVCSCCDLSLSLYCTEVEVTLVVHSLVRVPWLGRWEVPSHQPILNMEVRCLILICKLPSSPNKYWKNQKHHSCDDMFASIFTPDPDILTIHLFCRSRDHHRKLHFPLRSSWYFTKRSAS